jgi:hypothetical protein
MQTPSIVTHTRDNTLYVPQVLTSESSKENNERAPETVEFKLLSLLRKECWVYVNIFTIPV